MASSTRPGGPKLTAYALTHALQLLAVALVVGFMAIVQWTVVPSQDRLDGPAYARFEQQMNVPLQRLTPVLLITGIVAGVLAGVLGIVGGVGHAWLHLVVAALLAAMTVSTLLINAPVNRAIDGWDADAPPTDWADQRARWERGHALRVGMGLPALLLAVVAAVL